MSAAAPLSNAGGDPLWLCALLAGLGAGASVATAQLRAGASAASEGRMCIDGGATALLVARAPGPRRWEAHVLAGVDTSGDCRHWSGLRIGAACERHEARRTLFRARAGTAVLAARAAAAASGAAALGQFEEWHRLLGPHARIYSVGTEPEIGGGARIGWQFDRHAPVRELVTGLAGAEGWRAASASLAMVHGFDATTTLGPWSVSLAVAAPARGVRLGSTRWAWAVENDGKRARLARWIDEHGGDGAYAAAVHDVLMHGRDVERRGAVGRAVEVDIVGGTVGAATAYLAAPAVGRTLFR
jgi:hypothetical protein